MSETLPAAPVPADASRLKRDLMMMNMRHLICLLLAPLVLSGCLTATNPFYLKTDIFQDDRILGNYSEPNGESSLRIERNTYHTGRYAVHYSEGPDRKHWLRLTGTLFRVGGNVYMDLHPETNSAIWHMPATPATGTSMLHGLVYQPLHLLVKFTITDEGVGFSFMQQPQLFALIQKDPSLRKQLRDEQTLMLTLSSAELRAFLEKHDQSEALFPKAPNVKKPTPLAR